jgi:hypothetical protein
LAASGLHSLRTPRRWPLILRTLRAAVTVEPGLGRLALAALTVARRAQALEVVTVVPPAVRSVRLDRGWFHVADPEGLAEVVQRRFVAGEPDGGCVLR